MNQSRNAVKLKALKRPATDEPGQRNQLSHASQPERHLKSQIGFEARIKKSQFTVVNLKDHSFKAFEVTDRNDNVP